jgi:glycolate oxidase FAD binding subunit
LPSASELEPDSVSEVAACLADASARGNKVSIERSGGDIVLLSRKLDRLLEHEKDDLTVTVETGIRLSALNRHLAPHGQMLALDPPGDPTVGEILAGDLFGPRVFRYGRPRDLVLGTTLVLADGTIASAGGKVVKNVAGYDLARLVCGSAGRLGFIARASLRLHPLPATIRTLVVEVEDVERARRSIGRLLESNLVPSAVDLLWPGFLAILFEGSEVGVEAQVEAGSQLLEARVDDSVWPAVAERQRAAMSRSALPLGEIVAPARAALPEGLIRVGATCFVYESMPRPSTWSPLAERVRAEFDPNGVLV